jgi:hypothetical protein
MNIEKLNAEFRIRDDQKEVICLVDYSKKQFDVFKNYDDKNFTSKEIMKYYDLICAGKQLAEREFDPSQTTESRVKIKENASRPAKKPKGERMIKNITVTSLNTKICVKCNLPFVPNSNRQKYCSDCTSKTKNNETHEGNVVDNAN